MEIGKKIKRLRLQRGLTQEELADRCELSKGFISLLERDLTSPSIATLMDILESLGIGSYGPSSANRAKKSSSLAKTTSSSRRIPRASGAASAGWCPSAQKNDMEPILLELGPGGETAEDDPHEGEEFGYVLSGTLKTHIGRPRRARQAQGRELLFPSHRAPPAGERRARRRLPRALGESTARLHSETTGDRRNALMWSMRLIELEEHQQELWRNPGAAQYRPVHPQVRVHHPAGPVGLRQDHACCASSAASRCPHQGERPV